MAHLSFVSLEAAWETLAAALPEPKIGRVARFEALGRTLAKPVLAIADSPAWEASAMDGYALSGMVAGGTVLEVSATIAAGDRPDCILVPGTAAKIMTGAPMPRGADRVAPVEGTDGGARRVRIDQPPLSGAHIRRAGEIFHRGDEILSRGCRLSPAALALLASQGMDQVEIFVPPRVAFFTTGDEVVAAGGQTLPGQLRNSHADFLQSSCKSIGIEAENLGIVGDRRESIQNAIARGFEHDLLLVTGGVSQGDFDFVPSSLVSLGCETLFHGVAVRPGKPLLACRHPSGLVLGLPGNPGSVIVAFALFAWPLIQRWMGRAAEPWREAVRCELATPLPANPRTFDRLLPARLWAEEGHWMSSVLPAKGSHDLAAFARANALLRLRPGDAPRATGATSEALPLPGS